MSGYTEAPQLNNFFSTYNRGTPFCFICLRTNHETKLVYNNEAVIAFAKAIKMDMKLKHNNICFICEYKALKALQFFRSLTFAAALDTIFSEVLLQKRNDIDVFHRHNFKRIMENFGLPATPPSAWEAEFTAVRKSTTLRETKTLAFCLDENPVTPREASSSKEIYLIPDEPPDTDNGGEITDIHRNNPHCDALNMKVNYMNQFTGILKGPGGMGNSEASLFSKNAGSFETLVILDDNDTNEQSIKIAKVESQAPKVPDKPPTPRLVPIQQLLQRPRSPKIVLPLENLLQTPREVFTGDSLLITNPHGPSQLHPIAIKEGVTVIPSLDAQLVDGVLICNKSLSNMTQISNDTLDSQINEQSDILKTYLGKDVKKRNRLKEFSVSESDSQVNELATPVKKNKVLPANEDRSRIDWEDKIPMDVISFVDAVDPNPLIEPPKKVEPPRPPERLMVVPVTFHTSLPIEPDPLALNPRLLVDASVGTLSIGQTERNRTINEDCKEADALANTPSPQLGKQVSKYRQANWLPTWPTIQPKPIQPKPPITPQPTFKRIIPKLEDTNDVIDLC